MRSEAWRGCVVALILLEAGVSASGLSEEGEAATVVVTTGDEQSVVESHVRKWDRPDAKDFGNVLDYVLAVLVARADPPPEAASLKRRALAAMAAVASGAKDKPAGQLESAWLERVRAAEGFDVVLEDPLWTDEGMRRSGIDAGLRAMLGKTGWLLGGGQAEAIRKLVEARTDPEKDETAPEAPLALKRLDGGVVYVRVPTFEDKSIGRRVVKALEKELDKGDVRAVLLDVRNTPGGRPEQANAVADLFLDGRVLQIMRFADGHRVRIVSRPGATRVAVAVLVNRHTGSGAEMLAMALGDNERAVVVGEPTAGALFGKDFADLPDRRMVIFRTEPTILSPSGADYAVRGVPPDKRLAATEAAGEAAVQAAVDLLRTKSGTQGVEEE